MTTNNQLLLTFLLNACWQIAVVVALAYLSDRLLKNSPARHRHWVWVVSLLLAIGIPITTSSQLFIDSLPLGRVASIRPVQQGQTLVNFQQSTEGIESFVRSEAWLLNRWLAYILIAAYLVLLLFCAVRLLLAWRMTRRILNTAMEISEHSHLGSIFHKCALAIGNLKSQVKICVSESVQVPVTIGVLRPVIILPSELLAEQSEEILSSALGHELIHIRRRDYALNFVYELLFLPIAFHPGASLIRRRIRQTRELSCDELVAERILSPEAYARSLLKLASSAPTLRRLSVTTTVGIADADILEARIMSLLRKSQLDSRRRRMLLIAASVLLLVPCLGVASFAMKFDLQPLQSNQDPQEKEVREKKERREGEVAETERRLVETKIRMDSDPQFREEILRKQNVELEMRAVKQAALFRLARINMDQAIQIATSQTPGKVWSCTLDAYGWEKPGELAKDGKVFYRVVIVTSDDPGAGMKHVWVDAVDGQIIRTETELPRKIRQQQ